MRLDSENVSRILITKHLRLFFFIYVWKGKYKINTLMRNIFKLVD